MDGLHGRSRLFVAYIVFCVLAGAGLQTVPKMEPGAQGSMTFELPVHLRGEWEMACFIPGHYDGGMHGAVVVY
jgi:hypothetical protein